MESDGGSAAASGGIESDILVMMSVIFGMVVCCLLLVIVGLLMSRSSKSKTDQRYSAHEPPPKKTQQRIKVLSPEIAENASPSIEMSDAQRDRFALPIKTEPVIVADFSSMDSVMEGTKTTGNDDDIVDAIDNAVVKLSIGEDPYNDDIMVNDVNKMTEGNIEDTDVDVDEISDEQLRPIQYGGLASKSGSDQTKFI